MYEEEPAQQTPADKSRWTHRDDVALVDALVHQRDIGQGRENVWTPEAWAAIAESMKGSEVSGGGAQKTVQHCKARWQRLKIEYKIVKFLRQQSCFGWDNRTGTITAPMEVWSRYIAEHKDIQPYRRKPFPAYERVRYLVEEGVDREEHEQLWREIQVTYKSPPTQVAPSFVMHDMPAEQAQQYHQLSGGGSIHPALQQQANINGTNGHGDAMHGVDEGFHSPSTGAGSASGSAPPSSAASSSRTGKKRSGTRPHLQGQTQWHLDPQKRSRRAATTMKMYYPPSTTPSAEVIAQAINIASSRGPYVTVPMPAPPPAPIHNPYLPPPPMASLPAPPPPPTFAPPPVSVPVPVAQTPTPGIPAPSRLVQAIQALEASATLAENDLAHAAHLFAIRPDLADAYLALTAAGARVAFMRVALRAETHSGTVSAVGQHGSGSDGEGEEDDEEE